MSRRRSTPRVEEETPGLLVIIGYYIIQRLRSTKGRNFDPTILNEVQKELLQGSESYPGSDLEQQYTEALNYQWEKLQPPMQDVFLVTHCLRLNSTNDEWEKMRAKAEGTLISGQQITWANVRLFIEFICQSALPVAADNSENLHSMISWAVNVMYTSPTANPRFTTVADWLESRAGWPILRRRLRDKKKDEEEKKEEMERKLKTRGTKRSSGAASRSNSRRRKEEKEWEEEQERSRIEELKKAMKKRNSKTMEDLKNPPLESEVDLGSTSAIDVKPIFDQGLEPPTDIEIEVDPLYDDTDVKPVFDQGVELPTDIEIEADPLYDKDDEPERKKSKVTRKTPSKRGGKQDAKKKVERKIREKVVPEKLATGKKVSPPEVVPAPSPKKMPIAKIDSDVKAVKELLEDMVVTTEENYTPDDDRCKCARLKVKNRGRNWGRCDTKGCCYRWCLVHVDHCHFMTKDILELKNHLREHAEGSDPTKCFNCGAEKVRGGGESAQCGNCKVYWCLMSDCINEYYVPLMLESHQLNCHTPVNKAAKPPVEAEMPDKGEGVGPAPTTTLCKCGAPKTKIAGKRSAQCDKCSLYWCLYGNCGQQFHDEGMLKMHLKVHKINADPKECFNCGHTKPIREKGINFSLCPNCATWWCMVDDCNEEFETRDEVWIHHFHIDDDI